MSTLGTAGKFSKLLLGSHRQRKRFIGISLEDSLLFVLVTALFIKFCAKFRGTGPWKDNINLVLGWHGDFWCLLDTKRTTYLRWFRTSAICSIFFCRVFVLLCFWKCIALYHWIVVVGVIECKYSGITHEGDISFYESIAIVQTNGFHYDIFIVAYTHPALIWF